MPTCTPEPTVDQQTLATPSAVALFRLVFPVFFRFRVRLLFGFMALLLVDMLQLTIPRYLKIGVDELAQENAARQKLLLLCACIILTAAVSGLLRFAWRTLIIGFSRRLEAVLRNRLFDHVLRMDQAFLDRHPPGDLMAHAANDLAAVQMAFGMGMAAATDIVVMAAAALAFMLHISPFLTLIAALPLPLLAACTWLLSRELHRRFSQVQAQFGRLTEFARNTLVAIRLIKSCTREAQQIQDFEQLGSEHAAASVKTAVMQGLLLPVSALAGSIGTLLLLSSGGKMVVEGSLTLGEFVAFSTYFSMLSLPLTAAGWTVGVIRRGLTSLGRLQSLLSEKSVLAASIRTDFPQKTILQSRPHVSFRRLSFFYPSSTVPALAAIDLEIGPGMLGLTGKIGSGKSTLCRLMVRQYPVEDGMMLFAGHDANRLDPALIRRHVGYVGRDSLLLSGTVAENISLAHPAASSEEIMEAARLAAIHDEIMSMSDGYRSRIGEKGLRLSGGQKQRLAIARALLADRPILVIDDALSALDPETAQQVLAALRIRQQGKTLLLVSHNPKLLACTDHVLIFDQGRIADQGSHEHLLVRSRFYRKMAQGRHETEEGSA